jgi:hypothetical protein
LWEEAGRPQGRALEHYFKAEAILNFQERHGLVASNRRKVDMFPLKKVLLPGLLVAGIAIGVGVAYGGPPLPTTDPLDCNTTVDMKLLDNWNNMFEPHNRGLLTEPFATGRDTMCVEYKLEEAPPGKPKESLIVDLYKEDGALVRRVFEIDHASEHAKYLSIPGGGIFRLDIYANPHAYWSVSVYERMNPLEERESYEMRAY